MRLWAELENATAACNTNEQKTLETGQSCHLCENFLWEVHYADWEGNYIMFVLPSISIVYMLRIRGFERFLDASAEKFRSSWCWLPSRNQSRDIFLLLFRELSRVNNSAAGAEMGGGDDTHRFKNSPSRAINKLSLFPLTRMGPISDWGERRRKKSQKSHF